MLGLTKPTESGMPKTNASLVFENSVKKLPLWNVNEVAHFLGVSPRTVRDWVYKKIIPFRKAGKTLRFAPEEVEAWTLQNKE
jgi:excisionase family DNA binding protein